MDSPIEIMEEEAINTVEELWDKLFSIEAQIDTDNFYTDQGTKRTSDDPSKGRPAKSSQNGTAGNPDPLPPGYSRGTCSGCVQVIFETKHKHSKKKKMVCNWGLLLYMTEASSEEVHHIEDQVIEYLVVMAKPLYDQKN